MSKRTRTTIFFTSKKTTFSYSVYQQHGCINKAEEDMLTIAEDEVMYKLGPEIEITEAGTEDSSDTTVPDHLPLHLFRNLRSQPHLHHVKKPDQAGNPTGEILTFPPLSFRRPLSSASGRNLRSCKISISGWSTSAEG